MQYHMCISKLQNHEAAIQNAVVCFLIHAREGEPHGASIVLHVRSLTNQQNCRTLQDLVEFPNCVLAGLLEYFCKNTLRFYMSSLDY